MALQDKKNSGHDLFQCKYAPLAATLSRDVFTSESTSFASHFLCIFLQQGRDGKLVTVSSVA